MGTSWEMHCLTNFLFCYLLKFFSPIATIIIIHSLNTVETVFDIFLRKGSLAPSYPKIDKLPNGEYWMKTKRIERKFKLSFMLDLPAKIREYQEIFIIENVNLEQTNLIACMIKNQSKCRKSIWWENIWKINSHAHCTENNTWEHFAKWAICFQTTKEDAVNVLHKLNLNEPCSYINTTIISTIYVLMLSYIRHSCSYWVTNWVPTGY